ncbi:esterase-like activity of phytase family protein [Tropicimonas marinistellae]|uniref:esterase-like activity of phytase family protein n=1 Tax=Tropicimonas marinistellae TaxID=1739787 RepID=UPI000831D7B7|nr:esterase-like activity of phytase family protein [Tropicimonas marinistellae]
MTKLLTFTSVIALTAGVAQAEMNFNRIASFATPMNMAEGEDTARETSAEIIAATPDGMTLVFTDSPLGGIGMIDITDPANPAPLGNLDMGGEPTAVGIIGDRAYVGVNTSQSYTDPSGHLAVVDIAAKEIVATCDLGGQPDSVAVAKDGSFVAVAIENERDEDAGDGRVGQMPAGYLALLDAADNTAVCDTLKKVELTGLAEVGAEDPEPEFVDINGLGETVVTMQENNHIAVVGRDGALIADFSAGAVDLAMIDVDEEGAFTYDGTQEGRVREPDAVKWLDDSHFVTANEGDMDGGSRGWTIFGKDGSVVYESGTSFEYAVAEIGHYPEKRSGNKGVEPESVEVATFGETPYIFIGAERASVVGVYDATDPANPVLKQLLPSGIGPEGYVAIPERNLLVSANEVDLVEDGGVRAHVMIYELAEGEAQYPMLTSEDLTLENGAPVGWGAISGMVADVEAPGILYAVNDSFYGMQPTIFKIDATTKPAKIVNAIRVTRAGFPAQKLDMEGIALDGEGGFWIASEGRTDRVIPHAIYHVSAEGEIEDEIGLPAELMAVEKRFGFEGVTKVGDTLWMAVQREWADDPADHVKLVSYNLESEEWGAVHYPKATPEKGWVGLSEIVAHGDWFYVIERDNQIGDAAVTKKVYRIPAAEMVPGALGGALPVVSKEEVRDLLPDLKQLNGYVQDKVEGLAIDAAGEVFVSTDNDGIDDHSGETLFFSIGTVE